MATHHNNYADYGNYAWKNPTKHKQSFCSVQLEILFLA